jgi:hypothetical protein
MIQPPKMSPRGLQSAGIASVRDASSPLGSIEFRRLSLERIPSNLQAADIDTYVALQYVIVNLSENSEVLHYCSAQILAIGRDRQRRSRP